MNSPRLSIEGNTQQGYFLGSNERGAILILTAILLVAVFSLAALAIDLTAAASKAQRSRQYVKLAALAALEEYNDAEGTHSQKMVAAVARANEIADVNVVLGFSGNADPNTIDQNEEGAFLEAGKWFYAALESSDPCSGDYPCFVEGADDSSPPNAFRISGNLHDSYNPIFARAAWGKDASIGIKVSATASVVPRHACFLVDLSPSMVRETHQLNGQGSEFAFMLQSDNPGLSASRHDSDWAELGATAPVRGSAMTVENEHYQDDYELRSTLSDANFFVGEDNYGNQIDFSEHHYDPGAEPLYAVNNGFNYRVDVFRDGIYNGPEPLRTVFEGLKRAIEIFKARSVAGDKVCLIFYDQQLSWTRIVKLTDDFDYLEQFVDWDQLGDPTLGFERAMQHALFPDRSGKTDMALAVSEAMKQFAAEKDAAVPTSDFMVLIGDGLTNCRNCPDLNEDIDQNEDGDIDYPDSWKTLFCEDDGALCSSYCQSASSSYQSFCEQAFGSIPSSCPPPSADCENTDLNGDGQRTRDDYNKWLSDYNDANGCLSKGCNNSPVHYWYAMNELKEFVEEYVYPSLTPVHVIMVGQKAGPHTVDVPSEEDSDVCLTDSEARSLDEPLVKPLATTWDCSSGSCWGTYTEDGSSSTVTDLDFRTAWNDAFYQVNKDMYDIAVMTGGIWGPIRPQGPSCSPSDSPPSCGDSEGVVDGRRMLDPYCRTTTQQIRDYMIKIIGQNPYTIVDQGGGQ